MKITAYFSHNIRGIKGNNATRADMGLNCDIASQVAKMLKNAMPALDLYVPADQDEVLVELMEYSRVHVESILEADKRILGKRDILIGFEYHAVRSAGMKIEYDHAKIFEIPIFTFNFVDEIPDLVARILEWYFETQQEVIDDNAK